MEQLIIHTYQGTNFFCDFLFGLSDFCIKNELILISVTTCRTSVGKESWEKLEGTFSLSTMPNRVVFYLEGPSPGIDLLIESVVILCTKASKVSLHLM